jgi:hypothetical protein
MTRHHIATVQPGTYFRPRHNGCVGSGASSLSTDGSRGRCPECLGEFALRSDGRLRYHRRKEPF